MCTLFLFTTKIQLQCFSFHWLLQESTQLFDDFKPTMYPIKCFRTPLAPYSQSFISYQKQKKSAIFFCWPASGLEFTYCFSFLKASNLFGLVGFFGKRGGGGAGRRWCPWLISSEHGRIIQETCAVRLFTNPDPVPSQK